MHTLKGTFVQKMKYEVWFDENEVETMYYPLKIVLPPNKSRVLYFATYLDQIKWLNELNKIIGFRDIDEYYDLKMD